MDPRYGAATFFAASVLLVAIRAPHGERSRKVPVARSLKGILEVVLLTFAWIGFFLPFAWCFSSWLQFADFPLQPVAFEAGLFLLVWGLLLFWRSHADLGTNWSITLEVREGHRLVTGGVYTNIRHPMYTALLMFSAGQALVIPNWIAAPAYIVPIVLITACRLGPEERMMEEEFGEEFRNWKKRTHRLIPGVW